MSAPKQPHLNPSSIMVMLASDACQLNENRSIRLSFVFNWKSAGTSNTTTLCEINLLCLIRKLKNFCWHLPKQLNGATCLHILYIYIYIYTYIILLYIFKYTYDVPIGSRPCSGKSTRFYVPHSCLIFKHLLNSKKRA